jgi:hypothetical protein
MKIFVLLKAADTRRRLYDTNAHEAHEVYLLMFFVFLVALVWLRGAPSARCTEFTPLFFSSSAVALRHVAVA